MSETNKTLRINTRVGGKADERDKYVHVHLDQDYNTFEILSMKIGDSDTYKLHNANYGVVAGRVLANGGFGVPNAKISIFIESDNENDSLEVASLYSYDSTLSVGKDDRQYNLLPDKKVDDCHKVVGSFPNKTYVLNNDVLLEVFDKYYKFTTRTNNSGDYLICGVPTGQHTLHMDLDISDCGILSQRPRDFVYKGYTIEQFENPNQFREGTDFNGLSQVFRQDTTINVEPFWGNEETGETIGITREDIDVNFKFEPTCVFIGCVVSDAQSNGISKKCIPTENMGLMEELTTGEGRIEMIRKTLGGSIEEFQIKGNALIDGNGTWCYQIPMNLDYMRTDEYGNMVPTDNPELGIPTRACVRFRVSLNDFDGGENNFFRGKVLIPHNPQNIDAKKHDDYDYNFGTNTRDESFRDLFWNNVYTVKSYIPRFQEARTWSSKNYSGIKACNRSNSNNPIPYNNIRIRMSFMFVIMCAMIKSYIRIVSFVNFFYNWFHGLCCKIAKYKAQGILTPIRARFGTIAKKLDYLTIADGLCPDMDTWYFAPIAGKGENYCSNEEKIWCYDGDDDEKDVLKSGTTNICEQTIKSIDEYDEAPDSKSIDNENGPDSNVGCLSKNIDYLIACVEMNLAQEYKVINFDFYNDWINGMIYIPRWVRESKIKHKRKNGVKVSYEKVRGCMADPNIFSNHRRYTQQCALSYEINDTNRISKISTTDGCTGVRSSKQKCHKNPGMKQYIIFGNNGGVVQEEMTIKGQRVYYCKPCEWNYINASDIRKVILYANDLVLLGSLNDCSLNGIPQAFKALKSSSYVMPTNLALTNLDVSSYLFAGADGTYCMDTISGYTDGAERVGTTYRDINQYYSSVTNTNEYDKISYGNTDSSSSQMFGTKLEDLIPVTEAAGIAWNYTGPGQGIMGDTKAKIGDGLYYPGGHFLGISCVNSQTNIKSCVNLSRICEIGVNMSQRRELVRKLDMDNSKYSYTYFVPTGLISTDDISDQAFRSMFASMNMRPLKATKYNNETGYYNYDFLYMRPNGFDGSLASHVTSSQYNTQVTGDTFDDIEALKALGVSATAYFDSEERNNTYRRTNEISKNDYFDFRFGLLPEDADNTYKQALKFYSSDYKLPQYENSFYFYFGLRDGSTALDRFNSEFFSTCAKEDLTAIQRLTVVQHPNLFVPSDSYISVAVDNCTAPYTYVLTDGYGATKEGVSNESVFEINGLTYFGQYTLNVTDGNGISLTTTFSFGDGIVTCNYEKHDITTKISTNDSLKALNGHIASQTLSNGLNAALYNEYSRRGKNGYGGYLDFDNTVSAENAQYPITSGTTAQVPCAHIFIGKRNTSNQNAYDVIGMLSDTEIEPILSIKAYISSLTTATPSYYNVNTYTSYTNEDTKMFVWEVEQAYDIYVQLFNGEGGIVNVRYGSVMFNGIESLDIQIGSEYLSYTKKNPDNFELSSLNYLWWTNPAKIADFTTGNYKQTGWLLKKSLFMLDKDAARFDGNVYGTYVNELRQPMVFGTPENSVGTLSASTEFRGVDPEGGLTGETYSIPYYYNNDYSHYRGYSLDDTNSIYPTRESIGSRSFLTEKYKLPYQKVIAALDGNVANMQIYGDVQSAEYNAGSGTTGIVIATSQESPFVNMSVNDCIVIKYNDENFVGACIAEVNATMTKAVAIAYGNCSSLVSNNVTINGIYKALSYPYFYRPFYVDFFLLEEKYEITDNVWVAKRTHQANVHNGITYADDTNALKFSKFNVCGVDYEPENVENDFKAQDRVIMITGETEMNLDNRYSLSGINESEAAAFSHCDYDIIEGHPKYTELWNPNIDINERKNNGSVSFPEVIHVVLDNSSADVAGSVFERSKVYYGNLSVEPEKIAGETKDAWFNRHMDMDLETIQDWIYKQVGSTDIFVKSNELKNTLQDGQMDIEYIHNLSGKRAGCIDGPAWFSSGTTEEDYTTFNLNYSVEDSKFSGTSVPDVQKWHIFIGDGNTEYDSDIHYYFVNSGITEGSGDTTLEKVKGNVEGFLANPDSYARYGFESKTAFQTSKLPETKKYLNDIENLTDGYGDILPGSETMFDDKMAYIAQQDLSIKDWTGITAFITKFERWTGTQTQIGVIAIKRDEETNSTFVKLYWCERVEPGTGKDVIVPMNNTNNCSSNFTAKYHASSTDPKIDKKIFTINVNKFKRGMIFS